MVQVTLDGERFTLEQGESVLDCLLRNKQAIAYSCRSGVCQSCLVRVVDGEPGAAAQKELKPTLRAGGYALACQCVPEDDLELRLPGVEENAVPVVIDALDPLNEGVMRLRLVAGADAGFECRPGQYLNLVNPDGVSRSYSIANDPAREGYIELHVGRMNPGAFSGWLFERARKGEELHLRGPAGHCFYVASEGKDYPLLLAATGTGLAPLYGIVRDALAQGHRGPLTLLHGALHAERLYYVDRLRELQREHPNFRYLPLALEGAEGVEGVEQGDIYQRTLEALDPAQLRETRVFLCGNPDFVSKLRKQIFLRGVASSHIYCDAFVTRAG